MGCAKYSYISVVRCSLIYLMTIFAKRDIDKTDMSSVAEMAMTREFVIRMIVPFRRVSLTTPLTLSSMACIGGGNACVIPSIPSSLPLRTMPHLKTRVPHRPCVVVIVLHLYDRYRKYQRHGLLGSLLLVNGKPVRSQ